MNEDYDSQFTLENSMTTQSQKNESNKFSICDTPIVNADNDKYNFNTYASIIAQAILENDQADEGTVIAIYGKWGSGKSSMINLIKGELCNDGNSKKISEIITVVKKLLVKELNQENLNLLIESIRKIKLFKGRVNFGLLLKYILLKNPKISFKTKTIKISELKCWWIKDQHELILGFLRSMIEIVGSSNDKYMQKRRIRNQIKKIGEIILTEGNDIIGMLANTLIPGSSNVVSKLSSLAGESLVEKQNLSKLHKELREIMDECEERFLIIIDDIDRMDNEEVELIFWLVKTLGGLPKFTYLLAYDEEHVARVMQSKHKTDGKRYLEKFIQAGFQLPFITQSALKEEFTENLKKFYLDTEYFEGQAFKDRLNKLIIPRIDSLRNLIRINNQINITWRVIFNHRLDLADFVSVETIRFFHPSVIIFILQNKYNLLLKNFGKLVNDIDIKYIESILNEDTNNLSEIEVDIFKEAIINLFNIDFPEHKERPYPYSYMLYRITNRNIGNPRFFEKFFPFASENLENNIYQERERHKINFNFEESPNLNLSGNIDSYDKVYLNQIQLYNNVKIQRVNDLFETIDKDKPLDELLKKMNKSNGNNEAYEELSKFFIDYSANCNEIEPKINKYILLNIVSNYIKLKDCYETIFPGDDQRPMFFITQLMPLFHTANLGIANVREEIIFNRQIEIICEFLYDFALRTYKKSKDNWKELRENYEKFIKDLIKVGDDLVNEKKSHEWFGGKLIYYSKIRVIISEFATKFDTLI